MTTNVTAATARRRIGGWLMIPDPIIVEAAGRAGFDWIGLDLQHGTWDLGTAFRGIQLLDAIGHSRCSSASASSSCRSSRASSTTALRVS